jgi:nucleotide-binding universal stress UspA family protein
VTIPVGRATGIDKNRRAEERRGAFQSGGAFVMSYKDILVYLDPTPASAARLGVALDIAAREGARLIGVDASTDDAYLGDFGNAATRIEPSFDAALGDKGVPGEFHIAGSRGTLVLQDYALPADLIVAPAPSGETRKLIHSALPDDAVIKAGAPVLVIPVDWPAGPVGKNIVIAWNGSREAKRAVRDALPLLGRAEKVTVFVFSQGRSILRESGERLVGHLARHGVTAKVSDWTNTGEVSAIAAMFADLDTQEADLVVAGAFGHSRVFESLFGGVSLDLLRQPVLPVLMSH